MELEEDDPERAGFTNSCVCVCVCVCVHVGGRVYVGVRVGVSGCESVCVLEGVCVCRWVGVRGCVCEVDSGTEVSKFTTMVSFWPGALEHT